MSDSSPKNEGTTVKIAATLDKRHGITDDDEQKYESDDSCPGIVGYDSDSDSDTELDAHKKDSPKEDLLGEKKEVGPKNFFLFRDITIISPSHVDESDSESDGVPDLYQEDSDGSVPYLVDDSDDDIPHA
eukprot:Phypoly_transcript_26716.p1 GENE.Phypoly_transcript_26716~~Phypoly_transcript_26716.p1  ORF type:complete len:130 (+),score=29.99 Phypoly_transcript_26716:24-413(+)